MGVRRKMVSERYTRANGYEADCEVIYGDTDSVMVHFRVADTARAMELGKQAAEYVSATFVRPIKLEFEKVTARLPRWLRVPPPASRTILSCTQQHAAQEACARRTGCPCIALLNDGVPEHGPSADAGVQPVPADQQEALCRPAVDQSRPLGQDGHQGVAPPPPPMMLYCCLTLFLKQTCRRVC